MNKFNSPPTPPSWIDRLLEWCCAPHLLEEVQGDLQELYGKWVKKHGVSKARWIYTRHALMFLRPYAIKKNNPSYPQNSTTLIRNCFITFLRNLRSQKLYSFINISGLAAGLSCFAFVCLWVTDELSYDTFHQHYNRIARLTRTVQTETSISESARSSAPMAAALRNDYAEVENAVRLRIREEVILHKDEQVLQSGILMTDPSFFEVFSYRLTRGDVATALNEPYSIVLTASIARKYFGSTDPMGQTLTIFMNDTTNRGADYQVTGIMPDPPRNAHFTFHILASFKTVEVARPEIVTADGWNDANCYTYLLLREGTDLPAFSNKITRFDENYVGNRSDTQRETNFYRLQPLSDIHLRSQLRGEISSMGNISQVYIFSSIGIFILLLAGINYTNLTTARSAARAKEVSVKKVVGAGRKQLILQYLSESVFTALLSLLLSFLLTFLLQPLFYQITGKEISLFSSPPLLIFLILLTVFFGILAGIYPAFILSSFQPVRILKGAFKSSSQGVLLRKTLVVSQFVITLILLTDIVIIYSQMSFINHKDLGYDKDALLSLKQNGNIDVVNGYEAFKNELLTSSLISGVTSSGGFANESMNSGFSETVDIHGNPITVTASTLGVEAAYLDVLGVRLLAGRNFLPQASGDTVRQIILNEMAVKKFGWENPEAAIGKPFRLGNQPGIVVGVVNNFHFSSLHQTIQPLAISPHDKFFSSITLKIDINKVDQVMALVQQTWKEHFPSALFDFHFLDQQIKEQYRAEERFSQIFLYFCVLSLLIACLGLYGLISYTAWQKTKEIGIRKVFGATTSGMAMMLSKDFLKLVLLASFIAGPAAWYFMHQWLQNFAYRISISWWMFAIAVLLVLLIALITVSSQAIKTALSNPVASLKNE